MAATRVHLWGALRPAAGGAEFVDIDSATIRELLRKLEEQYPLMHPFIEQGISVAIDGTVYQDDWGKAIPEDAEVYLLPRIEGG